MFRLENSIAIVTGSDSGIGRAIAVEFARAGADIAVTFHTDAAGGEETARQVREAGRRVLLKQLDVMDERLSRRCSRRWRPSSACRTSWSTTQAPVATPRWRA
jgi:NAD(P)-dependent dehydrogenase (short-subunit alcohol dehydrogenase family)